MSYQALTGYHDSILRSIDTNEAESSLSLLFQLTDGSTRKILLKGCEIFRIVDFTKQNITSRLIKYNGAGVDTVDISEKLTWATSLSDASSFLSQQALTSITNRILDGNASVLYLEPSYGAEMVALFSELLEQAFDTQGVPNQVQ